MQPDHGAGRVLELRRQGGAHGVRHDATDYVDHESVKAEIQASRRLCTAHGWPVIDVTRRSIEETAAAIINLHQARIERPS